MDITASDYPIDPWLAGYRMGYANTRKVSKLAPVRYSARDTAAYRRGYDEGRGASLRQGVKDTKEKGPQMKVETTPPEYTVTITMSGQDAQELMAETMRLGSCLNKKPNRVTMELRQEMFDAGVRQGSDE